MDHFGIFRRSDDLNKIEVGHGHLIWTRMELGLNMPKRQKPKIHKPNDTFDHSYTKGPTILQSSSSTALQVLLLFANNFHKVHLSPTSASHTTNNTLPLQIGIIVIYSSHLFFCWIAQLKENQIQTKLFFLAILGFGGEADERWCRVQQSSPCSDSYAESLGIWIWKLM